jgi:diadenosine tetraphosphatase ApaH/serine/threonine PP2A family protein phosphatase
MAILILSDVHANLEALQAVLAEAGKFDDVWFLGDAVGYGPDPNACVERLLALEPRFWLAGNHDWAALGRLDLTEFNPEARAAAEWTSEQLTGDVRTFLEGLEPRLDPPDVGLNLSHGSPRYPIWEYVLDAATATENFECFTSRLSFFGHTHVPAVYEEGVDGALRVAITPGLSIVLDEVRRMINPGGVGQPRDGDPRASYLLFDPENEWLTFHRVPYDIKTTQEKILRAGLPARLAARLEYGW